MKPQKIVVIEDEADILDVIAYNLRRENFEIAGCQDGPGGLRTVRESVPDLVLLDLMLPGLDGIEVCQRLKSDPLTRAIPVIMLTAKSEESDVVLGLGVGADDYITKPFKPRELIARVKAVLRRGPLKQDGERVARIARAGLVIDAGRHEVRVDDAEVVFTATEFRLLHCLASYPARVFSRDELVSQVIGDASYVLDRNIDVHIRAIRKKLGPYRDCVETVRGVGYRFRE